MATSVQTLTRHKVGKVWTSSPCQIQNYSTVGISIIVITNRATLVPWIGQHADKLRYMTKVSFTT